MLHMLELSCSQARKKSTLTVEQYFVWRFPLFYVMCICIRSPSFIRQAIFTRNAQKKLQVIKETEVRVCPAWKWSDWTATTNA